MMPTKSLHCAIRQGSLKVLLFHVSIRLCFRYISRKAQIIRYQLIACLPAVSHYIPTSSNAGIVGRALASRS